MGNTSSYTDLLDGFNSAVHELSNDAEQMGVDLNWNTMGAVVESYTHRTLTSVDDEVIGAEWVLTVTGRRK